MNGKSRVKVYHSGDDGNWVDKGVGFLVLVNRKFVVTKETSNEREGRNLLDSAIVMDDIYEMQGNTLIVWNDKEENLDLALSFELPESCKDVWNMMREIQGKEPDADEVLAKQHEENCRSLDFPLPTKDNLKDVLNTIENHGSNNSVAYVLTKDDNRYLHTLVNIFEKAEDEKDLGTLQDLFLIFKSMVLLNSDTLFQYLFSDEFILKLIAGLEYDPEISHSSNEHRKYLQNTVIFKEVIPFTNRKLPGKIHKSFRIQYLKESVLPRVLDDITFNHLNQIIHKTNVEIIHAIIEDEQYLTSLFKALQSPNSATSFLLDLIRTLSEFNNLLKHTALDTRESVYAKLIDFGLFDVIANVISHADSSIRHYSSELAISIISCCSLQMRNYIMSQIKKDGKCALLKNFLQIVTFEPELGVQDNINDALKLLLDPNPDDSDEDLFYNHYYENFAGLLLAPFKTSQLNSHSDRLIQKEGIIHCLDLLGFGLTRHRSLCEFFVTDENVFLLLKEKFVSWKDFRDVTLNVLRFIRLCVSCEDGGIKESLITSEIFEPIMEIMRENISYNNMISSSILELFDHISSSDDLFNVANYLVNNFESCISDWSDLEVIEKLQKVTETKRTPKSDDIGSSGRSFHQTKKRFSTASSSTESPKKRRKLWNVAT